MRDIRYIRLNRTPTRRRDGRNEARDKSTTQARHKTRGKPNPDDDGDDIDDDDEPDEAINAQRRARDALMGSAAPDNCDDSNDRDFD